MSKYDFLNDVKASLRVRLDADSVVESSVCVRNNDLKTYGISIRRGGHIIMPRIYIDRFYEDYLRKKLTISEIADRILNILHTVSEDRADVSEISLKLDDCRDKIAYRLLSSDRNKEYLAYLPTVHFLDLSIIFTLVIHSSEDGVEFLRITDDIKQLWGVSDKELLSIAKDNTPRLFPLKCEPLFDVLSRNLKLPPDELCPDELDMGMLILTNDTGIYGATSMLYEGVIDKIADELDSNIYVIPSSIHEVLILPDSVYITEGELNEMIRDINEHHLNRDEILSDRSYYYNRMDRRFYF